LTSKKKQTEGIANGTGVSSPRQKA